MGLLRSCVLIIYLIMNLIIWSSRLDASFTSSNTASHRRANKITGLVYLRVPRVEALVIKLHDRTMHPGDMSCWKNLISVTEFSSEFHICFPTARKGSTYSLVIYSDDEVFYVKYGISAEAVFRGIKGPDSSVKNLLHNFFGFKKVYVTIFEENPLRPITSLDPASLKTGFGLHALDTIVSNTLGSAGKVCMEMLSNNFKKPKTLTTFTHNNEKRFDAVDNSRFYKSCQCAFNENCSNLKNDKWQHGNTREGLIGLNQ